MDSEQHGETIGVNHGGSGSMVWTGAMSTYMLSFLSNLVAGGTRTSSGFKKVHLNNCGKALSEHFKIHVTGEQVRNHLKKWRIVWAKVLRLKKISGALWDEDSCSILLCEEHYNNYIQHPVSITTIYVLFYIQQLVYMLHTI